MAGTMTEGGRVAVEGAAIEALTLWERTEALVSMVKFLRLLKIQLVDGHKLTKTAISGDLEL